MPSHPVLSRLYRWVGMAGCVLALTACGVAQWQKIGSPAAQVAQSMGAPQLKVALPNGGERWIYSLQPAGQQVYHMVFDDQQRLQHVEQVLEPAHFYRLKSGVDNRQTVQNYFGKPALVERVANFNGDIWTYRFYENSFNRLAHVFIDPQGVVQRIMFTDEPRFDDDRW